jgi:ectoine hydroxylase-related dioxygenase (phytanoyl-CoA dioxygenase family)
MATEKRSNPSDNGSEKKRLKSGGEWPNVQPWVSDALVNTLDEKSGIKNIERFLFKAQDILDDPRGIVAQNVANVVKKEGIALVSGALSAEQIQGFKQVFPELIKEIRKHDPNDEGSRGEKRHSFGGMSTTNSQLHRPEFRELLDLKAITKVLEKYWDSKDFCVHAAGGDLNMAGSRQHQRLHSDISESKFLGMATEVGSGIASPMIAVNFLIETQTPFNGPLQHIPGTQLMDGSYLPSVHQEPEHWFYSTMTPGEPGTAVIRDVRCWHAGTPNLTVNDRPLPNCEYLSPQVAMNDDLRTKVLVKRNRDGSKQMTYEIWNSLSRDAKHLTRFIHAEEGEKLEPGIFYEKLEADSQACVTCPLFAGMITKEQ